MLALIWREEMHDHIAIIEYEPAFLGLPFYAALFLIIFLCGLEHAFRERVQHAVAGAVADHEIIGKGCYILDV